MTPDGPRTPRSSPLRHALVTATGNRASQIYLLIVLLLLAWVAVDSTLVHQQDASLAAVVPVLVTLPVGFAVLFLPDGSPAGYYLVIAAAALIDAYLIGLLTGRRR